MFGRRIIFLSFSFLSAAAVAIERIFSFVFNLILSPFTSSRGFALAGFAGDTLKPSGSFYSAPRVERHEAGTSRRAAERNV